MATLKEKAQEILNEKISKILSRNIKKGVTIFNVEGELEELKGQEKTISATTSSQEITPDTNYNGITKVTVNAVTSEIDGNIKAENIKEGETILGISGSVVELKAQEKEINPTKTQQVITPDENYNGINKVTIEAVTANIDENIKAENIKNGTEILGVTGELDIEDFEEYSECMDILDQILGEE